MGSFKVDRRYFLTLFAVSMVVLSIGGQTSAQDIGAKQPPTIVFMTDFGVVDDSVAICRGVMYRPTNGCLNAMGIGTSTLL